LIVDIRVAGGGIRSGVVFFAVSDLGMLLRLREREWRDSWVVSEIESSAGGEDRGDEEDEDDEEASSMNTPDRVRFVGSRHVLVRR
jgi:hypothetical protein